MHPWFFLAMVLLGIWSTQNSSMAFTLASCIFVAWAIDKYYTHKALKTIKDKNKDTA